MSSPSAILNGLSYGEKKSLAGIVAVALPADDLADGQWSITLLEDVIWLLCGCIIVEDALIRHSSVGLVHVFMLCDGLLGSYQFLDLDSTLAEGFYPMTERARQDWPPRAAGVSAKNAWEELVKPFRMSLPPEGEKRLVVLRDLMVIVALHCGYDARTRVVFRRVCDAMEIQWHPRISEVESTLARKIYERVTRERERELRGDRWRGLKIGAAMIGGGALLAVTGGLAAPALAAGITASSSLIGASAAATLSGFATTTWMATVFGATGAGLVGFKMDRRTKGVQEFEFESETSVGEEMCVSICVPGVLKDKADLQRGWGVEPRGPDVSAKERLRRFYYVHNREKVDDVGEILNVYKGREASLCKRLVDRYGADPRDPLTREALAKAEGRRLEGVSREDLARDAEAIGHLIEAVLTVENEQSKGATTVAAKSTAGKKRGDAKRAARPNSDNTPRGPAASSPRAPSNTAPTVHRHNKTKQSQVQHSSAPTEDLLGIFSDAGASTSSTYGPAAGKLSADIMDLFSVDSNNTSYASIHAPAGSVDANAGQDLISRPDAVAKPAADSSAEKTVDFSRERASVGNGDSRAPATSTTATSNDDTQLPATSTAGIVDSGFKTFVTSNTSASARVDSKPASTSTAATVNSDSQTPVTSTVQTPVAVLVIPPDKIEGEMLRGWTRTNSPVGDIHKRTTAATVGRGGGGGNSTNNERSRASNSNNPSRVSSDAVDTQKGVTTVLSFEASGAADRVADRFSEDTRAMAAAGKGGERGPVLWAEAALQRCQGDEELAVEFVEIRTAIEMEAFVLGDDAEKRLRDESEEMERHRVWFWQDKMPHTDQYVLRWESDMQLALGKSVESVVKSISQNAFQEALKYTTLATLMSALTWPLALISVSNMIDADWTIGRERADIAGKILADALLNREQGCRPVTLIGTSLGGRLIFACLEEIARRHELWEEQTLSGALENESAWGNEKKYSERLTRLRRTWKRSNNGKSKAGLNGVGVTAGGPNSSNVKSSSGSNHNEARCAAGVIENVALLGTPVGGTRARWERVARIVHGRVINGYSGSDFILGMVFRARSLSLSVAGVQKVNAAGVENLDLSSVVGSSHFNYNRRMPEILPLLALDDCSTYVCRGNQEAISDTTLELSSSTDDVAHADAFVF